MGWPGRPYVEYLASNAQSPLTLSPRSPLTIRRSRFTVPGSRFTVLGSVTALFALSNSQSEFRNSEFSP